MRAAPGFLLALLAACAAAPAPASPSDAGPRASPDAGPAALPTACADACRAVTLTAAFAKGTRAFDRVQFGLTAAATSASGGPELYLEAHAGGDPACPTESSPSPAMTLVLAGLRLPLDGAPRTNEDGLTATFLDFSGQLTDAPVVRATSVVLVPRALAVAEPGERLLAFDLDATFPGGSIRGTGFALHCDTYDDP
jgi:hypothetical protein